MYNLCDGDFTKFEESKKLKMSTVGMMLAVKEKKDFVEWCQFKKN